MRLTKISRNSQLYSEQQTIFILGVRKSHMSKVTVAHKYKLHVAKKGFSTEAYKGIAVASCEEYSEVNSILPI